MRAEGRYQTTHLGILLLILCGVFLGVRMHAAIQSVLAARYEISLSGGNTSKSGRDPLLRRVQEKDDLLGLESAGPARQRRAPGSSIRDPFHPAVVAAAVQAEPALAAETEPEMSLKALIFDRVSPSCLISVDGDPSGWMGVGESFHGWKITEIGPGSVSVSRNGMARTLSL
jgi:hypothetical protein